MKPVSFMMVAGEASGDQLAAELVHSLRAQSARIALPPQVHVLATIIMLTGITLIVASTLSGIRRERRQG